LRILSYSHVERDPAGGAGSATILMNAAIRDLGHVVDEFFDGEFGPRGGATRLAREIGPAALMRHALPRLGAYDVLEVTGPLGWLLFPWLRAMRHRRPPLLVARSYGLEHNDHRVRLAEHRARTTRLSLAYRVGAGFLTLRQVEAAIAASHLFAAARPPAAVWAAQRRLKHFDSCVVAGFGVQEEYLAADCEPDGRCIAWIGTPIERKGWRFFVEGFTAAAREDEHLTAVLFGTRTEPAQVLSYFAADVRHRIDVQPLVPVPKLIERLCACAALVSTSLSEGYHLAVLQTMAAGVPVFATREGFLADVPRAPGLFLEIAKGSPESLRLALSGLTDPTTASARRERAIRAKGFAGLHAWPLVAERTEAAYLHGLTALKAPR
jgi:glycosyltransferase involved in cell wall biosynthesis